ncbi:kinase-like domain-containing protein [Globomyces pollinis-pini]|nr:kinase-like domain-containing protein [Globomyces pollinis-pini]
MNPSEVTTQNSIQPPIQGHSMIGESVLFDSRLVIRKKMAGSGGCGQVYLALYSNQLAVAKIPIMEKHEDLVYQESNIMNALVSPWTVQVLHYISNSPMPIGGLDYTPRSALIVEYMNLGPLSTYLDKSGNESEEKITLVLSQTLSIATMAARGIEFMHSRGFNHLDIKPENILLHQQADNTVIAKLSDFGSTRPEGSYDAIFQTPGFIPPEGIVQHNQLILPQKTSKYDIYAFGGCLINMIFLANYAAMWSGTKKTIEQKKSFLSSSIGNSDLLQLIVDCLQDSPSLRPAANNIIFPSKAITRLVVHYSDPILLLFLGTKDLQRWLQL